MHTCSSYSELKINGLPLYKQGCIPSNYAEESADSTSSNFPPIDASTTALLVVDVQPEYWSECPAVRKDFPNFPSRISSLVENCRTQNVKRIIWVRAAYDYEHSPWLHQFTRLHQGRIPPVVEQSTEWEEFATPLDDEIVITKTSWSSTSGNTGLLDILKDDGIESVLVCGLITSVCVQHSAFGVFEAGFRTILVTDACADRGKERHKAALALYGDYMYELTTVDSLKTDFEETASTSSRKGCGIPVEGENHTPFKRSLTSSSITTLELSDDDSITTIGSYRNVEYCIEPVE